MRNSRRVTIRFKSSGGENSSVDKVILKERWERASYLKVVSFILYILGIFVALLLFSMFIPLLHIFLRLLSGFYASALRIMDC